MDRNEIIKKNEKKLKILFICGSALSAIITTAAQIHGQMMHNDNTNIDDELLFSLDSTLKNEDNQSIKTDLNLIDNEYLMLYLGSNNEYDKLYTQIMIDMVDNISYSDDNSYATISIKNSDIIYQGKYSYNENKYIFEKQNIVEKKKH